MKPLNLAEITITYDKVSVTYTISKVWSDIIDDICAYVGVGEGVKKKK